ncbi:hypothetical protein AC249_AIPGENE19583 [Exaiptasia diaphana]|nr:hypothetical protein AC249_AIPGENE19583 [Exaiptasia diaphana]
MLEDPTEETNKVYCIVLNTMSQSNHSEEDDLSSDSIHTDTSEESSEENSDSSDVDSSEEQEDIDVWARIQHQAMDRYQQEYEVLVQKYKQNGDSNQAAEIRANNALLPSYRKELREVLFDELKWMHLFKRDPIYKKIKDTQKNLMDMEGYDWEEATHSAIHQRKFLLNKLFAKEEVPKQSVNERFHPYSRKFSGFD